LHGFLSDGHPSVFSLFDHDSPDISNPLSVHESSDRITQRDESREVDDEKREQDERPKKSSRKNYLRKPRQESITTFFQPALLEKSRGKISSISRLIRSADLTLRILQDTFWSPEVTKQFQSREMDRSQKAKWGLLAY
jgi:hypothetical protein